MSNIVNSLPLSGAFCFGFLLGWLVYYINRHRTGEVQLADLGTIVGVVAGAAVTAFLGKGSGLTFDPNMFGAYSIGLLAGFLSYLIIMFVLVRRSGGQYDSLYFLDGRRIVPDGKYEVPEAYRFRPMGEVPQFLALSHTPSVSQLSQTASNLRQAAVDLSNRAASEPDASTRHAMSDRVDDLQTMADVVEAKIAIINFQSEEVLNAIAGLTATAKSLNKEAQKMKSVTRALNQAAKVIGVAQKLLDQLDKLA